MEESTSIVQDLVAKIADKLNSELERLLIEGLNKKGFFFKNKTELIEFVSKNVRYEDYEFVKERTYFVNDVPFFKHWYAIDGHNFDTTDMSINYGSYSFL